MSSKPAFILSLFLVSAWWMALPNISAAEPDAQSLKAQAYQAFEQKNWDEAAAQFQRYLEHNPDDAPAALDYAGLLVQLKRPAEAAKVLEAVHQKHPQNETAYFKLGELYVGLNRYPEAEKVFQDLSQSKNRDLATAAADALRNVQRELARQSRYQMEQRVFELAAQFKHREVLEAVAALEKQGTLSYGIEMQRLYAMEMLGAYAPALRRAGQLAQAHPQATDLALLRADLLAQLGRRPEAETIWKKIQRDNAGTQAALIASERLKGFGRPEENLVFDLAGRHKYLDAVAAINKLEQQDGKLSWAMEMQRLYAWQALGQKERALERATALAKTHPASNDLALFRADLLISRHDWAEASQLLKQVKENNPSTPIAGQAQNHLDAIPPIANLDKWYWGEAYLSGEYLGRFGSLVGSGFARHGYFVPHARWLQPYGEMRFTTDTRSMLGRERTIIADNFLGFSLGVRAQPFPTEYFFFYISGGVNKDLLDRRRHGNWAIDSQGGAYGFKSWGPGTVLLAGGAGEVIPATGNLPATITTPQERGQSCPQMESASTNWLFWRGDWFVDGGADFSYYQRYSSWIGYGQAHEGFRLFQLGPRAAIDAYAVENVSWDVRGNYFDNLIEIGPGVRLLWAPWRHWEIVLRGEWLNGYYFGRDDLHNRSGASGHYDDFRAALSLGLRW